MVSNLRAHRDRDASKERAGKKKKKTSVVARRNERCLARTFDQSSRFVVVLVAWTLLEGFRFQPSFRRLLQYGAAQKSVRAFEIFLAFFETVGWVAACGGMREALALDTWTRRFGSWWGDAREVAVGLGNAWRLELLVAKPRVPANGIPAWQKPGAFSRSH